MDSKHWDWGKGYCRKHLGNGVPCQVCIATSGPDLDPPARPKIVTREMIEKFIDENSCVEVHDAYERNREEWAERVKSALDRSEPGEGEILDWKSVRPVGEPIKGTLSSDQPGMQNIPKDSAIQPSGKIRGLFVMNGYDTDDNLVESENPVTNEGFEKMLHIDFGKMPKLPMNHYLQPEQITKQLLEDADAIYLPPRRASVAECDQPTIHEAQFNEPLELQTGDILLVSYTVTANDPMHARPLPLAERLALVAEQHRQRFLEAGVEDPDELLKLLGTEELIQPAIPGSELPKRLPRGVPLDMELIGTIIEAEGCSDELRAALMAQIAIYGAPTICNLLAEAGVDDAFIDSLTSNLQQG